MKRINFFKICLIIASICILLTGNIFAQDDIKIGIYHPLSGPSAFCGEQAVNGAILAVEEINNNGGVLNNQINLIAEDNENDVTTTVTVVRKLILQDDVCALIGDYFSSCTLAGMEVAAQYEVPNVCGISASPKITSSGNQWIFRTAPTDAMNSETYVKYIVDTLGYKTFTFMASDDQFGMDAVEAYAPVLQKYGAEILDRVYFSENSTDFRSEITQIKQKSPEVVVLVSGGTAGALFCKQGNELGLESVIMGLGTQAEQEFIETAGAGAEGVYCATTYLYTLDTPENNLFVEKYNKRFGAMPSEYSLSGYRNVRVIKEAIERAGTTDSTAIRNALRETDYMGIAGPIKFDENGQSYPWIFITKIENGKLTIVERAETVKPL
ncbi:MAG: ABC transporter substrate-binding protein [Eubacteriaceae bacterium]